MSICSITYWFILFAISEKSNSNHHNIFTGEMLRSSWFSEDVNSLLTLYTNKNEIESLIKLPVKTPFLADQRLIE